MVAPTTQIVSRDGQVAAHDRPAPVGHGFSFHDLLSALNPLQYLPVVGTIYRALTHDVVAEPVRRIGSMVVSGLLGGPVGVAINIGMTLAEKISGVDPEAIVAQKLNPAQAVPASATEKISEAHDVTTEPPVVGAVQPGQARLGWTPRQLAAYGVRSDNAGNLTLGEVRGADVLNVLEASRIRAIAAAAYGVAANA